MNLKELFKDRHYRCDCVSPEGWFDQRSWATGRKIFWMITLFIVSAGFDLLAMTLRMKYGANSAPADMANAAGVFLWLGSLIFFLGLGPEMFGTWHFAYKMKGEWHIHNDDPRRQLGTTTRRWVACGTHVDYTSIVNTIEGPIFRFRNGGIMFKALYRFFQRQDPNQIFWPVHGVTGKIVGPMRLADASSIYDVRLCGEYRGKPHQLCVDLDRAYDLATRFLRFGEPYGLLGDLFSESEYYIRLRLSVQAVCVYLTSTRDRRSSPVGKHARELLEAALTDDLGISMGPLQPRPDHHERLERLERFVAEHATPKPEAVNVG